MKLRTLKDLKGKISPITGKMDKPINQVSTDILKQEAIKWIKDMQKCSKNNGFFCLNHRRDQKICAEDKSIDITENCNVVYDAPYEATDILAIVDFIKEFFNIKESEIK